MANYGIIDLGSNTVRLCIYEVKNDKKKHYTRKDYRALLNNKAMAGLAAYVQDGIFTERGIKHAIAVLTGHNKRIKYFNCKRIDVFATAVLRDCTNSHQAITAIEKATGFKITLLSADEEAHLGFVGALSDGDLNNATLIDIGGGSTELTRVDEDNDYDNISLPLGSLACFTKYVKGVLPTTKEMRQISSALSKKLRTLENKESYHNRLMYGIGGSVRAAAKVYAEVFSLDERPAVLLKKDYDDLLKVYSKDPNGFAHFALQAAPERIHTVIPGCLIAQSLMDEFSSQKLIIAKSGVREGYLIERVLLNKK